MCERCEDNVLRGYSVRLSRDSTHTDEFVAGKVTSCYVLGAVIVALFSDPLLKLCPPAHDS